MDKDKAIKLCRKYADLALSISNREFYSEIAALIEQQAGQIEEMRNCDNCKHGDKCFGSKCFGVKLKHWEWDGGSGND